MTSLAYWASVRSLEIVAAVPIYGSLVLFLLGGAGAAITDLTLIRFYFLHVAALPLLALLLIYLHFSGVRRVGLTEVAGEAKVQAKHAFRIHLVNLAIILTILFGLLVSLAVLAPLPFEQKADPYSTVPGVGPPWYLLAPFGFLEWTAGVLPQWLAGSLLFLAFTTFLIVPFLDRSKPGSRGRLVALTVAGLIVLAWIAFTIYGARVA